MKYKRKSLRYIADNDIIFPVSRFTEVVYESLFRPGEDPCGKYIRVDGIYYQVVSVGYNPLKGTIGSNNSLKLFMTEDVMKVNEVVVTGSRTARPIKLSPVSTQVIGGKELVDAGYADLTKALQQETPGMNIQKEDVLDFDLYLADATPACTFGVHDEFISSGRLDDLSMCWAGVEAMIASDANDTTQVLAIFDNEETGSQTKQGAGSPFLSYMLQRIALTQSHTEEAYYQAVERAFMISADNAHAWHPNYSEKFDPTNHPKLGGGPVIKFNAAQKYASDAVSAAIFANICDTAGVPCQRFVNHSDVAGGSTLGNILASSIPLKGVDMGNAILAMHSCRETGSVIDHEYCVKAFTKFYQL